MADRQITLCSLYKNERKRKAIAALGLLLIINEQSKRSCQVRDIYKNRPEFGAGSIRLNELYSDEVMFFTYLRMDTSQVN